MYFVSLLFVALFADATDLKNNKISLLELYSSEGCSSCPPAEEALYKLRDSKDLWTKFVPVNFHVDYWNRLGWIDRFSNKRFTNRQHEYARVWESNRVYTPAFVVDGKDMGAKLPSIENKNQKTPFIITTEHSNLKFKVNIKNANLSGYTLSFALLANGIESNVKSGENTGRTLKHNFVVIDLKEAPLNQSQEFSFEKPAVKFKNLSYAVWISTKNNLEVVQSSGGDL